MRKNRNLSAIKLREKLGASLFLLQKLLLVAACNGDDQQETRTSAARLTTEATAGSAAPLLPQTPPVVHMPNAQGAMVHSVAPPCSIACSQLAVLRADVPADIEVARHWRFEACQNETCFEGRGSADMMTLDGVEGRYLYLVATNSSGTWTSMVSFQLKRPEPNSTSTIEVIFQPLTATGGGTMTSDEYVIRAKDENVGTEHELLRERVEYKLEARQIGENCSLTCWHGLADTRSTIDADAGS